VVYAVVRAGGRQEKVEVGSIITVDRISPDVKNTVTLSPVLFVDGDSVTHDKKELGKVTVTAEVLQDLRGPKIVIQKYKNKTGYKKRQGFRSELTKLKVTNISKGQ
jgi:large subunit ribosomal protein L21